MQQADDIRPIGQAAGVTNLMAPAVDWKAVRLEMACMLMQMKEEDEVFEFMHVLLFNYKNYTLMQVRELCHMAERRMAQIYDAKKINAGIIKYMETIHYDDVISTLKRWLTSEDVWVEDVAGQRVDAVIFAFEWALKVSLLKENNWQYTLYLEKTVFQIGRWINNPSMCYAQTKAGERIPHTFIKCKGGSLLYQLLKFTDNGR